MRMYSKNRFLFFFENSFYWLSSGGRSLAYIVPYGLFVFSTHSLAILSGRLLLYPHVCVCVHFALAALNSLFLSLPISFSLVRRCIASISECVCESACQRCVLMRLCMRECARCCSHCTTKCVLLGNACMRFVLVECDHIVLDHPKRFATIFHVANIEIV